METRLKTQRINVSVMGSVSVNGLYSFNLKIEEPKNEHEKVNTYNATHDRGLERWKKRLRIDFRI